MRPTPWLLSLCCALAAPAAALNQPDGTVIPQGSGLQGLFDSRGEAINALSDARIIPETFVPSCALTFTVLQRNAGYQNSFGWYNVTGQKPADSDLHEFLSCTDGIGSVKTLDIRSDPAYAGGEIGFFEGVGNCASPGNYLYVFYTQPQYNPDSSSGNAFIHLLTYDSRVTPRAFYFGWEDLIQGGDNDFDDLTTFVTGITCSGGGGPCSTGRPGVCADGTLQCRNGNLACEAVTGGSAEKCDGLDNDCNGAADEGDLCGAAQVCDHATCVPKCVGTEFPCSGGRVCVEGVCLEPACATVRCDGGKRCVDGQCVAPCDGVACPAGKVCRVGVCVDPCAGITCDQQYACVGGVCRLSCACEGCPAGQACQADGRCLFNSCVGKSCGAGEYCAADGTCKDACQGASCPKGQLCKAGECVAAPPSDAGLPGPDAGEDQGDGGEPIVVGGPDSGHGGNPGGTPPPPADGACGCGASSGAVLPSLALFAAAGWLRRGRGRRRSG